MVLINVGLVTTLSPVEKYAQAFGLDAKLLADAVSRKSGVDS
jgi:hypothetical protein